MQHYFCHAIFIVCLLVGPAHASTLYFGGNTNDANDHLFGFNGSTQVSQTQPPGNVMGPTGQIAVGADGNIYIADQQSPFGTVDKFDGATGAFLSTYVAASSSGLIVPTGLAWGPDGLLYIGDGGTGGNSFIDSFDGTTLTQVVAPNATLNGPGGLAFGPDGNLYFADLGNGSIDEYNLTTHAYSVFSSNLASLITIGALEGVAFGTDGNLYVTDITQSVVHIFNGTTGAAIGDYGNTGSVLVQPIGLTFAPDGSLYVVDSQGVQIFNNLGIFASTQVAFDSNPGDPSGGQFLALIGGVPEPSTVLLCAIGIGALGFARHLRMRARRV